MSKISREDIKKRFKTGMYPTQQDFENVFDSYVHKDDTIDPSKIVSGDENIVDIINRKAEERHNHPISEVDNLSETLQQIQDDLDTAEDNIAGHETRIVTLEAAKTDYEAFKERVRAFLEDANASDTTIDRWHEIENFLQGITDTETLTGLLNDLKQEILREIPEPQTGNFIEYSTDLDAETNAPTGKIMQYWGQSTAKYKRGHFYEKVGSELQPGIFTLTLNGTLTPYLGISDRNFLKTNKTFKYTQINGKVCLTGGERMPEIGDVVIYWDGTAATIKEIPSETSYLLSNGQRIYAPNGAQLWSLPIYENSEGKQIIAANGYNESSFMEDPRIKTDTQGCQFMLVNEDNTVDPFQSESTRVGSSTGLTYSDWQHLHVDDVIS